MNLTYNSEAPSLVPSFAARVIPAITALHHFFGNRHFGGVQEKSVRTPAAALQGANRPCLDSKITVDLCYPNFLGRRG